jgi:hypothetical protein
MHRLIPPERFLALSLLLLFVSRSPAAEAPVLIELAATDVPAMRAAIDALRGEGGRALHVFPPNLVIGSVGEAETERLLERGVLRRVFVDPLPDAEIESMPIAERVAFSAFRRLRSETAPAPEGPMHGLPGIGTCGLPLPEAAGKTSDLDACTTTSPNLPLGADCFDTSEFFIGSVAVGVFLLESTGSAYDWSGAEITETTDGVVAGMDWWVSWGGVMADLTFYYDLHIQEPTTYEPITMSEFDEALWIREVMANIGYTPPTAFASCRYYNNDIRNAYETNWAFSMFICDSDSTVNQGLFTNNGYAHAYFGGPWLVMSRYCTWAYNWQNYHDAVPAHETGHIFYATDEYNGVLEFSGYYNQRDYAAPPLCLMNENSLIGPCNRSSRQVGWRDLDSNGVHEVLDMIPETTLDPYPTDPTGDDVLTYTGGAVVTTLDNLNPFGQRHDITLNRITDVKFRVDGGAWTSAIPTDGAFDDYAEDYYFDTPPLSAGTHIIEAQAVNTPGLTDTTFASDTVTVTASTVVAGSLPAVTPLRAAPNPMNPRASIAFSLSGAARGSLAVYSASGRLVRNLAETVFAAGGHEFVWDGRDDAGREVPSGAYFVRLVTGDRVESVRTLVIR